MKTVWRVFVYLKRYPMLAIATLGCAIVGTLMMIVPPAATKYIVDDVINAGSATRGAVADLELCGAHLVAVGAFLVLGDSAAIFAASKDVPLETLSHLRESALWEPASCPLCASGTPLESA